MRPIALVLLVLVGALVPAMPASGLVGCNLTSQGDARPVATPGVAPLTQDRLFYLRNYGSAPVMAPGMGYYIEVWEETNGHAGLQMWKTICIDGTIPPDAFRQMVCTLRSANFCLGDIGV